MTMVNHRVTWNQVTKWTPDNDLSLLTCLNAKQNRWFTRTHWDLRNIMVSIKLPVRHLTRSGDFSQVSQPKPLSFSGTHWNFHCDDLHEPFNLGKDIRRTPKVKVPNLLNIHNLVHSRTMLIQVSRDNQGRTSLLCSTPSSLAWGFFQGQV